MEVESIIRDTRVSEDHALGPLFTHTVGWGEGLEQAVETCWNLK